MSKKRKGKHYNNSRAKRKEKNKKQQEVSNQHEDVIQEQETTTEEQSVDVAEEVIQEDIEESDEIQKSDNEEEEEIEETGETGETKGKKRLNKKKVVIVLAIIIAIIASISLLIWYLINIVFAIKDVVQVEVGTKTQLEPRDFLNNHDAKGDISIITDVSNIDFNKIAEYEIEVEFNKRKYKSKLQFVDTTPPQVEFKNVVAYIDYVFNAEDFIANKTDVTQMTVEVENQPNITEYKEYPITIIVKDEGGNETRGDVILNTSYIKSEFVLELGHKLTYEDLLANVEADKHLLPQSELDRISGSPIGEYEIKTVNGGREFITKIKVQDTTPPNLELKDVKIYDDQTTLDKSAFIKSVTDASEYTTELKTQIPFQQVGTYDIEIEAKDALGNTSKQIAKLNIVKDTVAPVFSGLSNLSIAKNANVDWKKGVTARDEKDGNCDFTVNTSSANLGVAGSYTITYTSKDKAGNTSTGRRKVTVNPDASDVNAKAQEWLGKTGSSPLAIKDYVANTIKYNSATNRSTLWGAWMGFTTLRGDCYVHAAVTDMLLKKAGYQCYIVNATDSSHFWNLVNVGGSWRHLDSTPPRYSTHGLMTDAEREESLNGKTWNKDAFPKAE